MLRERHPDAGYYIPINHHPFHKSVGLSSSEALYKNSLSLPIYFDLTDDQQMEIVSLLNDD